MTESQAGSGGVEPVGERIELYWRSGCGFCSALIRRLDRAGLPYVARDIWQDEDAAAFVRRVTGGDETVPTVRIGDVALVNPTLDEVVVELADRWPEAVPAGFAFGTGGGVGRASRHHLEDL